MDNLQKARLFDEFLDGGLSDIGDLPPKASAWVGHIPFGKWIVGALRPAVIVELGVHHGVSYLNFCSAVVRYGAPTRCYGVDHWQGDLHTNRYSSDVLVDLRKYHDWRFDRFSELMPMSFDVAVTQFADGSIDLLHIDGYHTYESVKHDFETWRPKLSDRAVVLFHDIAVRYGDFGVHQLWSELKQRYPHFQFDHASGLGVLAVGEDAGSALPMLFQSPDDAEYLKRVFGRVGSDLAREWQLAMNLRNVKMTLVWQGREAARSVRSRYLQLRSGLGKRLRRMWSKENRDPLIPPDAFFSVGGSPEVGSEFLRIFREQGGLRSQDRVLEIGSGTGRIARALTGFLDRGRYDGLDITRDAVRWCQEAYRGYDNFHFAHADIFNKYYNSNGAIAARDYRLPFADEQFDFVFLTSVFTHMLPEDIGNYLCEIRRVLRCGGTCVVTLFLLNRESQNNICLGVSSMEFVHPVDSRSGCLAFNEDIPEAALAYPESFVRELIESSHLRLDAPIHYGSWSGRSDGLSFQDVLVLRKP